MISPYHLPPKRCSPFAALPGAPAEVAMRILPILFFAVGCSLGCFQSDPPT